MSVDLKNRETIIFDSETSVLITMSHVKIGDFLVLAPYLKFLMEARDNITVAVPNILFSLFEEEAVFKRMISAAQIETFLKESRENHKVLDLTYPLLRKQLPDGHHTLNGEYFFKPQHVTVSYAEAFKEFFPEIEIAMKVQPYLFLEPSSERLLPFGIEPFQYYTIHAGSDFPAKNWPLVNFETCVDKMTKAFPHLTCVEIIGPCDEPLFAGQQRPALLRTIETDLTSVAHVLAGSLFHLDNDSGIHHLAGVLDVPTISVWGPTGPGTWKSLSDLNTVHWGGPNCAKHCGGREMVECSNRVCITTVKPADILRSAQRLLEAYNKN